MKKIRSRKHMWFEVGEYFCKDRAVMTDKCVHRDEVNKSFKLNTDIDLGRKCKGEGKIGVVSSKKGFPVDNGYWKPNVVASWCWNKKNKYCKCDCSVYTDMESCNSGYLNHLTNETETPYCWGCNWA